MIHIKIQNVDIFSLGFTSCKAGLPVKPYFKQGSTVDLRKQRAISGVINLIQRINFPTFLKVVLAIEAM